MGRFCLSEALLCIGKCYGECLIPIQKCRSCKIKQNHGSQNSNQHSTIRWQNQHKHTASNYSSQSQVNVLQFVAMNSIIRAVSLSTISWIFSIQNWFTTIAVGQQRKMNLKLLCIGSSIRVEWNYAIHVSRLIFPWTREGSKLGSRLIFSAQAPNEFDYHFD